MVSSAEISPASRAKLLRVAAKVFWWGTPEEGLADPTRFLAQVMTYGDWEDVRMAMGLLGEPAFEATLKNPPPGVFDRKSWNYWHLFFGLIPPVNLPERRV